MYICSECLVLLDDNQIKTNRCPIVTNHKNPHKPLLRVDDDMAHPVLRLLKKGYYISNFSGAQRNYLGETDVMSEKLNPKIPHVTFGFFSKIECDAFFKKFRHLRHLMQNWELEDLHHVHRVDEELQVITEYVLHSKRSIRDPFNLSATSEFYEIRFVGGGTKFSPAIIWDSMYLKDLTEEKKIQRERLLKDFYDSYYDYCKDFFLALDIICA